MSDEVYLENLTQRTHTIVLSHAAFRDKKYGFKISNGVAIDTDRNGNSSQRVVRRALPGALTLLPGEKRCGLHPAIVNEPQVKTLLAQKAVRVGPDASQQAAPATKVQPSVGATWEAPQPPQAAEPRDTLTGGRVRVAKSRQEG